MEKDQILYDPQVHQIATRYLPAGNHLATIVNVEELPPEKGKEFRYVRLQWKGTKGEIRQDLICDHWGDASKAETSLRITGEKLGSIAKAVGHDGPVSLKKMFSQLGNKQCAVAVRAEYNKSSQKYYNQIDHVAAQLNDLDPYVAEDVDMSRVSVHGDATQDDLDQIKSILKGVGA